MKVAYQIRNLGRLKWSGEVVAQSEAMEHIEAALVRVAQKHLMSRDITVEGTDELGKFLVGGFRVVGEYERKGAV